MKKIVTNSPIVLSEVTSPLKAILFMVSGYFLQFSLFTFPFISKNKFSGKFHGFNKVLLFPILFVCNTVFGIASNSCYDNNELLLIEEYKGYSLPKDRDSLFEYNYTSEKITLSYSHFIEGDTDYTGGKFTYGGEEFDVFGFVADSYYFGTLWKNGICQGLLHWEYGDVTTIRYKENCKELSFEATTTFWRNDGEPFTKSAPKKELQHSTFGQGEYKPRQRISLPDFSDLEFNTNGILVFELTINEEGIVVNARLEQDKSTLSDKTLIDNVIGKIKGFNMYKPKPGSSLEVVSFTVRISPT